MSIGWYGGCWSGKPLEWIPIALFRMQLYKRRESSLAQLVQLLLQRLNISGLLFDRILELTYDDKIFLKLQLNFENLSTWKNARELYIFYCEKISKRVKLGPKIVKNGTIDPDFLETFHGILDGLVILFSSAATFPTHILFSNCTRTKWN